MSPAPQRYHFIAVSLHWLMALGIFALIGVGLAMKWAPLPKHLVFELFQLHKSIGVTILLLAVLRLAWRLIHAPPPLPPAMPARERRAARAGHFVLYALMLFMPLCGWAYVSASPFNVPTVLYGVLPWPHIAWLADFHDKKPVADFFKRLHDVGAFVFIVAILGHVGAALRHAIKGDVPLWRMALRGAARPNS